MLKSEGELRDWARRRIRWLAVGVFAILFLAFSVTFDFSILALSNFYATPWGAVFAVIALIALAGILVSARWRHDRLPFAMAALFFCAAFLTLAVMFWPHMIPYSVTVADAASPDISLRFLLYFGIVVLPVIALYMIGVYWIFRGKFRKSGAY